MTLINRSVGDVKVGITINDTFGDFLNNKLVAGPGITLTVITAGDNSQTLVVATENEPDQFGLFHVKFRTSGSCRIPMFVGLLYDQTYCPMRKVAC